MEKYAAVVADVAARKEVRLATPKVKKEKKKQVVEAKPKAKSERKPKAPAPE